MAFIIPGLREHARSKGYAAIAKKFRERGCDVQIVNIDWNRKVMSEYITQFRKIAEKEKGDIYFLGFSFGAIIAFVVAFDIKPKALFICSMSSYFAEDLASIPTSWKNYIGKRQLADAAKRSFAPLAKGIQCPTYIFVGEKEAQKYPTIAERAKAAAKSIKHATLTIVPNGKHDLSQPEYRALVEQMIDQVIQ